MAYFVSVVLYFLIQYRLVSFFSFILIVVLLTVYLSKKYKRFSIPLFVVPASLLGMAFLFFGPMLNAAFLNQFGSTASAVITSSRQTSSRLNEQYIWAYEVLVQTAQGEDVISGFDTMSASIWPLRNQILIPPEGERFIVKHIASFPKNLVILSDESEYGRRRLLREEIGPIDQARQRYKASPSNAEFKEQYIELLRQFITRHEGGQDLLTIQSFKKELKQLEQ